MMDLFLGPNLVDLGRKTARKGRKLVRFLQTLRSSGHSQDEINVIFQLPRWIAYIVKFEEKHFMWSKIEQLT